MITAIFFQARNQADALMEHALLECISEEEAESLMSDENNCMAVIGLVLQSLFIS